MAVDGNVDRVRKQVDAVTELPEAPEAVSVTVLHVFDDSVIDDSSEMVDPTRVEAVNVATETLEERGIDVSMEGRGGDPSSSVVRVAEEVGADSIFVGGPKRSPAGKAIFGSVAQSIILNADRPVMVTIDR
jgi:nucleotide-binding universal stress UspA family protein